MNGVCNSKLFYPVPGGPGEGTKGQISFNSITKSISKICIPNFVCVLTNKRNKTYQMGFLFCRLGHACPRGGTLWCWGAQRVKKKIIQTWSCGNSDQMGMTTRTECK